MKLKLTRILRTGDNQKEIKIKNILVQNQFLKNTHISQNHLKNIKNVINREIERKHFQEIQEKKNRKKNIIDLNRGLGPGPGPDPKEESYQKIINIQIIDMIPAPLALIEGRRTNILIETSKIIETQKSNIKIK